MINLVNKLLVFTRVNYVLSNFGKTWDSKEQDKEKTRLWK